MEGGDEEGRCVAGREGEGGVGGVESVAGWVVLCGLESDEEEEEKRRKLCWLVGRLVVEKSLLLELKLILF